MELALELKPVSLIGFGDGAEAAAFTAMNPATGSPLEPKFFAASAEDLERAAALAQSAFPVYSKLSGEKKGAFLRQIAAAIEGAAHRPSSNELIWKQRYPRHASPARWAAPAASCDSSLKWWKKVPG